VTIDDVDLVGGDIALYACLAKVSKLKRTGSLILESDSYVEADSKYSRNTSSSIMYYPMLQSADYLSINDNTGAISFGLNSNNDFEYNCSPETLSKTRFLMKAGVDDYRGGWYAETQADGSINFHFTNKNLQSRLQITSEGSLVPSVDTNSSLGLAGKRFSSIFLQNAPIVGSDRCYKQNICQLSDVENLVAKELRKNIKVYELIDTDQKIHVGMIAQEIISIFNNYGLDAHKYKMIHKSEEDGRYAVIYEQLIMFMLSAS
jgi:hypothetical protein